jgi:heme exporter protein A
VRTISSIPLTAQPRSQTAGSAALVSLAGVEARVGRALILCEVDLGVAAGEVVGVMGANGSGKTTLLRVAATLLRPSAGSGIVLGAEIGTPAVQDVRPEIALVGHVPALYPELTLEENLRLVARLRGAPEGRVAEVLAAVGLDRAADRRADHCSQGMRRRTDLARALLTEPRLLLLDEAHVGLDRAAGGLLEVLVGSVRARGGAALVVSHDAARIEGLVDRTVVVANGRLHPGEVNG